MKIPQATQGIRSKLWLISLSFSIPIAVLLAFLTAGFNQNLSFAAKEAQGLAALRPLVTLLHDLSIHQSLLSDAQALNKSNAAIARNFDSLEITLNTLSAPLELTPEGLAKRHREHLQLSTLRQETTALLALGQNTPPELWNKAHRHLLNDLRSLITHVGDTSNLILDPDLDSFYLMDALLVGIPQAQDRLGQLQSRLSSLPTSVTLDEGTRLELRILATLLSEADIDRTVSSLQTALNEDGNAYGLSQSLQSRLPSALASFKSDSARLLADFGAILGSSAPLSPSSLQSWLLSASKFQDSSLALWSLGAEELDSLLQTRIDSFQSQRRTALLASIGAVIAAFSLVLAVKRSITRHLLTVTNTLNTNIERFSTESAQLVATSATLAEGASTQAASLEEISATLEEISSMTKRNADHAANARSLADQTHQAADNGAQRMAQMSTAMQEIKASSDKVASIMKTIDEIAFQTNILALNAAVEAARAGEAGAGFGVVAEEVRNLAQRCASAARETASQIEDSIRKSELGVSLNTEVATHLNEIVAKARQVNSVISEIAQASSEQSQGITQLTTGVSALDQTTQANAASAEETASVARELNSQVAEITSAITHLSSIVGPP